MELLQDENIAPEDLVSKCACCFKILKKQQKILSLNDELEAIFCDVIQLEFYSKAYAKYICGSCNDKLLGFSRFKTELSLNQRRLYESLLLVNDNSNPDIKVEPTEEFDVDEYIEDESGMEWKVECLEEDIIEEEDETLLLMTEPDSYDDPIVRIPNTPSKRGRKKRSTSPRPSFFTCQICKDKTFTSRYHYRNHLESEHPDRKENQYWTMTTIDQKTSGTVSSRELCPVCAKWITTSSMDAHIKRMHSDEYYFFCDLCPQKFKVKRDIQYHVRKHMEKESRQRFQCEYCENSYLSTWALRNHFTMQHADIPKDFVCECGAAFKTQMRLNYHRKIVHIKGEFPCTICNKMFTSLPNWRVHTAQFHRTKDPCVVCGKLIAPGAFMKRHMRSHAPASFECPIEGCTKVFFGKTALVNHQASVHGMGERVSCEICGSSFSTKKVLSKHIARTHSVTERVPCEVPGCTHTAARKDYFIGHIKTHKDIDDAQKAEYIKKIKAMKSLPW